MSPSELKKFRSKQRKAAKKAEQIRLEEKKKEEKRAEHRHKNKRNNQNEDLENSPVEDLVPNKLERPEDPLAEAMHFLQPLQNLASDRIQTHLFSFEIYYRREKPLLMLQSLKRAVIIDKTNSELHTCLVRYLKYYQEKLATTEGPIVEVVKKEMSRFTKTLDSVIFNEDFLNKYQDSFPHRFQAARSMVIIDQIQRDRALNIATTVDSHLKEKTLVNLISVLEWLESSDMNGSSEEIMRFKATSRDIFPYSLAFRTEELSKEFVNNIDESCTELVNNSDKGSKEFVNNSDCVHSDTIDCLSTKLNSTSIAINHNHVSTSSTS